MNDSSVIFESHRQRLLGVAYRMLGSRAEAEDIVQEAYLRWHDVAAADVRSPEGWLVTTVTRLCIDHLRLARTSRETYVGPWLPEPLVGDASSSVDATAELASNLSIAFLVLLEQLDPEERAAFVLREVFESDYSEIAQVLGKSEAACRQIASRARRRVHEKKPRVEVSDVARKALLDRFVQAIMTHDKNALLGIFANEASWTSDGGGKARAARRIIRGRERVARFVLAVLGRYTDQFVFTPVRINGEAGLAAIEADGRVFSVISIRTDGIRILDVFAVLNPDKLPRQLRIESGCSTPARVDGEQARPAQKGATHASHGIAREGCPRVDGEQAGPAQKGATHASHGIAREGCPRVDGEQARPAQKGATHASHGIAREGCPRIDGEQARPAQKEMT